MVSTTTIRETIISLLGPGTVTEVMESPMHERIKLLSKKLAQIYALDTSSLLAKAYPYMWGEVQVFLYDWVLPQLTLNGALMMWLIISQ